MKYIKIFENLDSFDYSWNMNNKPMQLLSTETKIAWGITEKSGFSYDPQGFWLALKKRMNNQPLNDYELSNYMRGYIICTILEINLRWPQRDNEGKNNYQKSILSIVVSDLMEFYEKEPQKYLFNYITKLPSTDDEKRHLHRHLKGKARLQILTAIKEVMEEERDPALKPKTKKVKKQEGLMKHTSEYKEIKPKSFSIDSDIINENGEAIFEIPDERYIADIELTEMDEEVLKNQGDAANSSYDKANLKIEISDFFNSFYLENRDQLKRITPYFTNISFSGIRTKDVWTNNKLDWNALEIWSLLKKIDKKEELSFFEKGHLYHFYLVVCIAALKQKSENSVLTPSSDASQRVLLTKPIADILCNLVIKTFLFFTFDLYNKVFRRVLAPPPVSNSDVKFFSNAIKDKPREMLKKMNLPQNSFPQVPVTKYMSNKKEIDDLDDIFNLNFNLHELFESFELFESLSNKVILAFESGSLDHLKTSGSSQKSSERQPILEFTDPVMTIRAYDKFNLTEDSSQETLKAYIEEYSWRIATRRREYIKYALLISDENVIGVYRVKDWLPPKDQRKGRVSLICEIAESPIREKYYGKSMAHFRMGKQTAIQYFGFE